jgi:hypothetical protein
MLTPNMENPIEQLAASLQRLPREVRWLYAQSSVVQAAALSEPPERGPRSRIADCVLTSASYFRLTRVMVAAANVCFLLVTYLKQSLTPCLPKDGVLFVGIKALREPELVHLFKAMQGKPVVHLDERDLSDFFRQSHVSLPALFREMRSVWSEVPGRTHASSPSETVKDIYLLSFFAMNGHRFAYFRAWFRRYLSLPGKVRTVAWTTASYVPFAAIAVGVEVIHMVHGFQSHSLVYPDFTKSICFDVFTAEHVRRRLPRCAVTVISEPTQGLISRRVAAVAGIYGAPDRFDLIRPYIDWALRNDLPVIVRKHPADTSDYWEQWRGIAGIKIDDGEDSFIQFLDKHRPRFLASWFSTALYDAILKGVVPVTVTPESHYATLDIVFPFRDLSLCWPEHEHTAQNLLDNDNLRAEFLAETYACTMTRNGDCSKIAAGHAKSA